MGMDCHALKYSTKKNAFLHVNWARWRYLGELLTQLGCPMEEFAYSNDGENVSEDTARQYGEAIRDAVDAGHVFQIRVADKHYEGGFLKIPVVGFENPTVNLFNDKLENNTVQYASSVELKTNTEALVKVLQGKSPDACDAMEAIDIHSALLDLATKGKSFIDLVTGKKLEEIDDERREWLLEWAEFFINSGGFSQY